MPNLQLPTPEVRESFLAAMAEFAAEKRGAPDDHTMIGTRSRPSAGRGVRLRLRGVRTVTPRRRARGDATTRGLGALYDLVVA